MDLHLKHDNLVFGYIYMVLDVMCSLHFKHLLRLRHNDNHHRSKRTYQRWTLQSCTLDVEHSDWRDTIPVVWNLSPQHLDTILRARSDFRNAISREIFITACWVIWLSRNSVAFDNAHPCLNNWKRRFKEELGLVCTKAKSVRKAQLVLWRDSYN